MLHLPKLKEKFKTFFLLKNILRNKLIGVMLTNAKGAHTGGDRKCQPAQTNMDQHQKPCRAHPCQGVQSFLDGLHKHHAEVA